MKQRCAWPKNPLAIAYHDKEWGVPVRQDRKLFECLVLEGAQAERRRLLADAGIVRHAGKIEAAIVNARGVLAVRKECGSFAKYVWSFSDAEVLSKDLKKRGFRFIGPTTVHAFMQAVGMVNAHDERCFRHREIHAK